MDFKPSEPDGTHKCPHCKAHYKVLPGGRLPARDSDTETCEVCGKTMAKWNSTTWPRYRLISGPNDADRAASPSSTGA